MVRKARPMTVVSAWEDDPGAPGDTGRVPVGVPAPNLSASPFPLALAGAAPAPKRYAPGTAGFRHWNAAVALRRGADLWGAAVPKGTRWQPGGTLEATLDHGADLNAYYDRKGLWFFHERVKGTTVWSGESPDVLCHELGHAILDAVRSGLWDVMGAEVAAFHESFGDMSALLSALQVPSLRVAVLSETGGTLYRASRISRLAEQLGWAIRQLQPDGVDRDALRSAVNAFLYRDPKALPDSAPAAQLSSEPHNFSRVFTGGFFEALGGMVAVVAKPATDAALAAASRDAALLLIDAARVAPVAAGYYSSIAAAMLAAERQRFKGRYAEALKSAFVRRGILSLKAAARPAPKAARRQRGGAKEEPAWIVLDADEFALGRGKLHVQAPTEGPAVRGVAPERPSAEEAARAFAGWLFRRGRVDLGGQGNAGTRIAHPHARKTHHLVRERRGLVLRRRCFDGGAVEGASHPRTPSPLPPRGA